MKKRWFWTILSMLVAGVIFVSCSDSNTSEPFSCNITYPESNELFYIGDEINVTVETTDEEGMINEVRFYFDEVGVGSDPFFPYSFIINTTGYLRGNHYIKVISEDNEGNKKTSKVMIVLDPFPSLTVTSPNSETSVLTGEKYSITWDDNFEENVSIDLYKSDILIESITNSTESDGEYEWEISDDISEGNDYLIKIKTTTISGYTLEGISDEFKVIPASQIFVQGGTFPMGDHYDEGSEDEKPVHNITLSDYYIGKNEVTQAEWEYIMTGNTNGITPTPSAYIGSNYPVGRVRWYDIMVFCNRKSIKFGLTPVYSMNDSTNPDDWGIVPNDNNPSWNSIECDWSANGYRLPTEAEWEYAARGGIHHTDNYRYSGCSYVSELDNYSWNRLNSMYGPEDVGTKQPNQLGIYDMSGNNSEWCWDGFSSTYYRNSPSDNPHGPMSSLRVVRGGSFGSYLDYLRVAKRYNLTPYETNPSLGFRPVRAN
ncbi:MAG: SUMF1/EgtB/PvdO family nonheme iron enzyme [Candidatus Delongbacteria bacterium]|nr:SUMF1/EgtB/PvdO family nonheme iron enzyme [Candidatus Delongbacteria bacterium]MBN2835476.1 SUMF1/EgtB/PvdO family nonheme iron enzyme [Candidatus Delongbacteria bacterium]